MTDRILNAFNRWFTSRRGVWHVFWLSVVVTIVEVIWPSLDHGHFTWLFVCTVWSFFTQNALACASREAGERSDRELHAVRVEEDQILDAVQRP